MLTTCCDGPLIGDECHSAPELLRWALEEIKRLRGAVEEEREACAQLCTEEVDTAHKLLVERRGGAYEAGSHDVAAIIRERICNRGKK